MNSQVPSCVIFLFHFWVTAVRWLLQARVLTKGFVYTGHFDTVFQNLGNLVKSVPVMESHGK